MYRIHQRLLAREQGRNYRPPYLDRIFQAAREQSDGLSSDSDDDEGDWNGPGLHPARSQQIMGQIREYAENLHRESLAQRAAREANQEICWIRIRSGIPQIATA